MRSRRIDVGPARQATRGARGRGAKDRGLAVQLDDPPPRCTALSERERAAAAEELAELEREKSARAAIGPAEINAIITETEPRRLLEVVVGQITLDPDMRGEIVYRLSMASLRGESSNQLFDTLEEWSRHLDRNDL
jgi:hypothetical protein